MNGKQALARLESLGSAQTRKIYGRHGVLGEMYGVKFGDIHVISYQLVGVAGRMALRHRLGHARADRIRT